jgi:beta-phosphoglucomutase family hydrolase
VGPVAHTDARGHSARPGHPIEFLAAAIFDVDGVVTRTATVHAAAWRAMFDVFLEQRARERGDQFVPFSDADYRTYVDGVPRFDGVARFLASRGIEIPWGDPDDAGDRDTICGLGNRKNAVFLETVSKEGVEPFETTVRLLERLRQLRIPTAAVSASENCAAVLDAAGVTNLFSARVDGIDAIELALPGKPDPAIFREAARRLAVAPSTAAVIEDAVAGVQAGRSGGFGLVVGVDRSGHPNELATGGADVVVSDLSELRLDDEGRWSVAS